MSKKNTIYDLGLSGNAVHALQWAGKRTVDDLLLCSENEIRNMRRVGSGTFEEIMAKIAELRLKTAAEQLPEAMADNDSGLSDKTEEIDDQGVIEQVNNAFLDTKKSAEKDFLDAYEEDRQNLNKENNNTVDDVMAKIESLWHMSESEDMRGAIFYPTREPEDSSNLISSLGLSVRATNALMRAGKRTIDDLLLCSEDEIRHMRNVGAKTVDEIMAKIEVLRPFSDTGGLICSIADSSWEPEDSSNSILSLGLSVRATNALMRAGKRTIDDLLLCSEDEIRDIRNVGTKTVDEIMATIEVLRQERGGGQLSGADDSQGSDTFFTTDIITLISYPAYHDAVRRYIKKNQDPSIYEIDTGNRESYQIYKHGFTKLSDILFLNKDQLVSLPGISELAAQNILDYRVSWIKAHEYGLRSAIKATGVLPHEEIDGYGYTGITPNELALSSLFILPASRYMALRYAENHDEALSKLDLDHRARRLLQKHGYTMLSDILILDSQLDSSLPDIGIEATRKILDYRQDWLEAHGVDLRAAINGDKSAMQPAPPDLGAIIIKLYKDAPYAGLSLQDFIEKLPSYASHEQIKHCVGELLANGTLEYIDYRCYRVYPHFAEAVRICPGFKERNREIILSRLAGKKLQQVGQEYGMTKERVRQIVLKGARKVRTWVAENTGQALFDEDYYSYFYEAYEFDKKTAKEWLGFSDSTLAYLDMIADRRGTGKLAEAVEDTRLSSSLRQRIRNYLNHDKLFIDGQWIPKKRSELEEYVVTHFCKETVSYNKFAQIYNSFLSEHGIPYDKDIFQIDDVMRSRKNRLADSRFLLWKSGETIRAYDVDGRDYTQLFIGLGLDTLENIELSTQKFVEDYPELLTQYDIRDRYELHNLLRKVLPEGSFHDFKACRMPHISFGNFDRDSALFDLMVNNAPISQNDLADLIHSEYGYDRAVTLSTYLLPLNGFYHQGMYTIDQKAMTSEHQAALLSVLDSDFYYIDELRHIYVRTVPDADPDEINPYNLKSMGFTILSRYAFRNYSSLDAYFRDILTQDDLLDITDIRRRYSNIQMFSSVLTDLKRSLEIVEYEPNQIISFRKLSAAGVSREDIEDFCDAVYDFVDEGVCFTAKSLRLNGFTSDLYELGFSDWFYANLLLSDSRFSHAIVYKAIILIKGDVELTRRFFEESLISAAGSIDVYDLIRDMENIYGCSINDRSDVIYTLGTGSNVYYDKHLDRLYDSEARYWSEVDEAEVLIK